MPDQPFTPDPSTIELRPARASVAFVITAEGYLAVSLYLEDETLGAFDVLVAPEAAAHITHELDGLLDQIVDHDPHADL